MRRAGPWLTGPWLAAIGLAAGLGAFAAMTPLAAVAGWIGLDRLGLTAASVEGGVWAGRLHDASLRGVPLGEVDVALDPASLLTGTPRFTLKASGGAVTGQAVAIPRSHGLEIRQASGEAPLSLFAAGPRLEGRLRFDGLGLRFADGRCEAADGRLTAQAQPTALGAMSSAALAGQAACAAGALVLPLQGRSGDAELALTLTLQPDGRYDVRTRIATTAPELGASLRLAGFSGGEGAQARTDRGRLW